MVIAPAAGGPSRTISFEDVAQQAGIRFVLENHPTPQKHLVESMPGGIAAFDYNNDGRTDIFFTNGAVLPSLEKESSKYFNRLYRNDGAMRFTDVTAEAGVHGAGYSMGAAAGDYDNDGNVDLFVAGVFRNILYRNSGNGRFQDVTAKAGIKSELWAVAGGWFDYDNDGRLDLFVVNYAKWSTSFNRFCGDRARDIRIYCHPKWFHGLPNNLYHNRGDGTFEDVTARSGIGAHVGRGMSVAFADYNSDGHIDAFVTNDNLPNFLFRNLGNGRFEETALLAGVALLDHGSPIASMGADFRDYNNDGLPDVTVTALAGETFPVFRNLGKGQFQDAGFATGMSRLSRPWSGWGNGFVDLDNDGWKDLFTANSHVNDRVELFESTVYKQSNAVFLNTSGGKFRDTTAEAGDGFRAARAHRGCAFADFDGDGRLDVVVSILGEPAELWRNVTAGDNRWLLLKLRGARSNRDGIGAIIRLAGQTNHMTTAVGYASSSHYGVHFGVEGLARIDKVEIRWPSGILQVMKDVETNRMINVIEPQE